MFVSLYPRMTPSAEGETARRSVHVEGGICQRGAGDRVAEHPRGGVGGDGPVGGRGTARDGEHHRAAHHARPQAEGEPPHALAQREPHPGREGPLRGYWMFNKRPGFGPVHVGQGIL